MTMVTVFAVVEAEAGVAVLDGDEQPVAVSSSRASIPPRSLRVSDVVIYFPPRFSNAASHSRASV